MLLTKEKYISIYSQLSYLRMEEVTSAEHAIERRDFNTYLDAEYHFNRVNRIIRAEFPELDEGYMSVIPSARKNATFPDWPYSNPFETPVVFSDGSVVTECDIPF